MNTYTIEATPAGRGFAYGTHVADADTWEQATEQAAKAAANCNHPTIFWAVERGQDGAARPVVRCQEFGAPSPFRPGKVYASAR